MTIHNHYYFNNQKIKAEHHGLTTIHPTKRCTFLSRHGQKPIQYVSQANDCRNPPW